MENDNIAPTFKPLFDNDYIKKFNEGEKRFVFKYYLKRFINLFSIFRYDFIVIEKELFPYLPPFFEYLLRNKNYIIDIDDAIFHNYDLNPNRFIRFFLKNKMDIVFKYSHTTIAGNSYLYNRALKSGANKVKILPTVINLKNYYQIKKQCKNQGLVIGWIGSPSTLKYLKSISKVLESLIAKYNIKIYIVGASENIGINKNVFYFEWQESKEVEIISKFDIGIMPLMDTPWARGKCAYKLIQYMGCGIPSVASPVGMNKFVIKHNENGFHAVTHIDWFNFLELLICDEELRVSLGNNSYDYVKNNFTTKIVYKEFINCITGSS
ncbi:glycosyltransferase [Bacteroidia bacterium]|nr:glycosyltransferase [Bacteroidia bacterium]